MSEKMTPQIIGLVRTMQALVQSDIPRDEAERRFKIALAEEGLTPQQFASAISGHAEVLVH